jgi:hypothetical protein
MNTRSPLAVPFAQWPLAPATAAPAAGASPAWPFERSPLGQRLAGTLRTCVMRRQGRLERLELVLVHTLAAGTGWSTDWRLRAAIECPATADGGAALVSLRTVDRGALPPGSALEELWRWIADTSAAQALLPASLTERVQFSDAAAAATLEVIRHRVLRSSAVLERLPARLDVRLGSRRRTVDYLGEEHDADPSGLAGRHQPAGSEPDGAEPAPKIPVVRLVARFAQREGTRGDTRVVLWSGDRDPQLVALLRDCARRLDPRHALAGRHRDAEQTRAA